MQRCRPNRQQAEKERLKRGKEEKKNKDKTTNETAVVCTGNYRGHIIDDRAKVPIKTSGHFSQLDI